MRRNGCEHLRVFTPDKKSLKFLKISLIFKPQSPNNNASQVQSTQEKCRCYASQFLRVQPKKVVRKYHFGEVLYAVVSTPLNDRNCAKVTEKKMP